jgi:hypothetical protein
MVDHMPATITTRQNEPGQIKRLRAQRHLYARAKRVVGLQILLTTIFPVAGAVAVLLLPKLAGTLAFYGIVISILDVAVFEPWQKGIITIAAKIQEAFDCYVLDLPWDEIRVGSKPEDEEVHAASAAYLSGKDDTQLQNWYPTAAGDVPLALGRIICQRANLRWDSALRRRYRTWLAVTLIVLGLVISAIGLRNGSSLEGLTIGILAPLAPMIMWGIREYRKHGEAADTSDRLRATSMALWTDALKRQMSDDKLSVAARQLQSEIYGRRSSAPIIFNWIYQRLRDSGEEQMNVAADELVRQAKESGF